MDRAYLELKLSWEMYRQPPEALDTEAKSRVQAMASRQNSLERRILRSREATGVVATPDTIAGRIAEIRARYSEAGEFEADLRRAGLDFVGLEAAIARDVVIENTLERVVAGVRRVNDTEAEIYYHSHPDRFTRPEKRELRHILMTFNNLQEQQAALECLNTLRRTCASLEDFAAAALRHSHCPTAMDGGRLGKLPRGQLFESLDAVAFELACHENSPVTASPMGLHVLRCEAIEAGGLLPFAAVRRKLVDKLTDQRLRRVQQEWIRSLSN